MSKAPNPIHPHYTAIAIAYHNRRLIADEVLPRTTVNSTEFKYQKYNLADGFTIPDTIVGRKSKVNQVDFSSEELTESTNDHGLEHPVPKSDIDNAPEGHDPLARGTEQTTNLILLDREVRTSKLVFNASSYAANNTETLSGSDQWSHANCKPLPIITDALDSVVMRPNIGIFGRRTLTMLRRNPSVVKAYNGTSGDEGMVPLEWLKDYLELEMILVGEANLNVARPGQEVNLARVWGNHASFIYRDRMADTRSGTTFGLTAEFGSRIATNEFDKNIGLRGGQMIRVGESVRELVTAPDLGFFFENAVAAN